MTGKIKCLIVSLVCLLTLLTVRSNADVVGFFDGLDNMVKRSDAVLLIRIKEHVESQHPEYPNNAYALSTEQCEVLKTFKGDVPENSTVTIRMFDGDFVLPDRFRRGTCYVVFLNNYGIIEKDDKGNVRHFNLKYEHNNIPVSPKCDLKPLAGKSLKESLKILIAEYRKYREEQAKHEDDFFDKLLKESAP